MDLSAFSFYHTQVDDALSPAELKALNKNSVEKKYAKGIHLFEEGNYPKGVFFLKKGKVKLYQSSPDGSERIITIHRPGEILGYRPVLSGERYPVSAKALEACNVNFIPKKDFQNVLRKSSGLANLLLQYLSHEFTVWVNMTSIFSRTTVKERLFLYILMLSEIYREGSKWPIRISLPKSDLACLVSTSNETLARMLKILKQEGLVHSRGSVIEISNIEQLRQIQQHVSMFV